MAPRFVGRRSLVPTQSELRELISGHCAIIAVRTDNDQHACAWTGTELWDPSPGFDQPRSFEQAIVLAATILFRQGA
jgi:hypothetical protein